VGKETPANDAWTRALLRAERQALEDVARAKATAVGFYEYSDDLTGAELFDRLEDTAEEAGFVTARVPVYRERAFDELDVLVRAVGRAVRAEGMRRGERGLPALLDLASTRRGVAKALESGPPGSEVFELARAYFAALERAPAREANRIQAWLSGAPDQEERAHMTALTRRTAKRALADLTRLVRVLGHKGTVFLFEGAHVIGKLPDARREQSYIVLRELIDNADGGRGMVAVRVLVGGTSALFSGPRSLAELEPLAMRVLEGSRGRGIERSRDGDPLPHDAVHGASAPVGWSRGNPPAVRKPTEDAGPALRAILRAAHGVPATEADLSMTVATERIDRHIDQLLSVSSMEGSVFAMVSGAYGSGKTHLLLHLTARALKEKRTVFRLSLERLDADLGNPQRHLHRLLDQSMLPLEGRPSALDVLGQWTATDASTDALLETLGDIAETEGEAANAAMRALRVVRKTKRRSAALRAYLSAHELSDKPAAPSYRQDAYGRFLLWLELLARHARSKGPVLLIDEAENLYRLGMRESERRTALRSLSFYCGGALPSTAVVLAITPDALVDLRRDARTLLAEVDAQSTLLAWEDASMLRRRLKLSPVLEVPPLDKKELLLLATKVRRVHELARGRMEDADYRAFVSKLADDTKKGGAGGPRAFVRALVGRLERAWWLER
jgi:hypothetical protein